MHPIICNNFIQCSDKCCFFLFLCFYFIWSIIEVDVFPCDHRMRVMLSNLQSNDTKYLHFKFINEIYDSVMGTNEITF